MPNLAELMAAWASQEASVKALVLIGSQARATNDSIWRADAESDWDFQIITSQPEMFASKQWTEKMGAKPTVYAIRRAAIGGVPKIAAIFSGTEADFVVISARGLGLARWLLRAGFHLRSKAFARKLQDLAVVIRPGWQFLKGAERWQGFYRRVVAEVADPRLSDEEIRALAESFVCDRVWTERKIVRGELIAAQRMLHRSLVETNFRLLHELKLRRGERSFPEARRAERIAKSSELELIRASARLDSEELRLLAVRSEKSCFELTSLLLGPSWCRPSE